MKGKVLITPRSLCHRKNDIVEMLRDYEVLINETGRPFDENELKELIQDVDGIIVGVDKITREILEKAKKLKVITKYGVGLDNIDIEYAKRLGIRVTYTPGANKESVADLVFTMILELSRQLFKMDKIVRDNRWDKVIGREVYGKVIGIIGTGNIGKSVAKRATGFDMKILGYDMQPDYDFARQIGMKYVDLQTLLKDSDYITLHIPFTKDMYHFIDREKLNMIKSTAFIVNTSRGELINEEALYEALKQKRLAGAALDVFEIEPPYNSKLIKLENVILSPHCGASTEDAIIKMNMMAVEGLKSVLEGKEPKFVYA
ncbi:MULTISPECIES: phosphoglycerate dehydrogenase [Thermoanaerobacterium]|uniref:D-isomer specific 2-hydroxyacid dehydrogenase NAD-binding protein n=2 Tax=Thermoanaerobacterium TaxID=28895 RepID=W9E9K2_9THEO|nr:MULTISPECIES: phosphoglycerate dehydrogenase [Thermoanaerobacterium]AFK87506.1 D-isomer specific 2-hydroxyacid dehydrogenase NAD-binding protein [Thermoanaerobacterium saccharolyticum JW/SL-YS485]ETO37756.1 D-isomer specific 2-hydroxyacid dehydrogenase NAD-binding protein [Thermoanaerobacterium aotearoense SCUT27]